MNEARRRSKLRFGACLAGALVLAAGAKADETRPAARRPPATGWKLADLAEVLRDLRGRDYERGKTLFAKARCVQCHPANDVGKEFGPDLTKLDPRFQPIDILRDILEPSRRIADARYDVWSFETRDGRELAGLVMSETFAMVKLMQQPPAQSPPIVLERTNIESRRMLLVSMMPERLLDELTSDEIADLVAYVAARGDSSDPVVQPPEPPTPEPKADEAGESTSP